MSLLDKTNLLITPNAVKSGKLYSVIPSNGTGDLTVVRNTTATRVNSNGFIESVASNVPRLNYDTVGGIPYLLIEPQRTNILLNSATLVNQSITTTAAAHTLSFRGTGTLTLSGSFSGSLVGTGANNRVTLTFTSTAATLTVTISGSCSNGQIELGGFATSHIPTLGAAVTRNVDLINKTGISDLIGQTEGVVFIESSLLISNLSALQGISIGDGTGANRLILFYTSINNSLSIDGVSQGVSFPNKIPFTLSNSLAFNKMAIRYQANLITLFVNGAKISIEITGQSLPVNLNRFGFDSGAGGSLFFGKVKRIQLYKTSLTDAECIDLTTL